MLLPVVNQLLAPGIRFLPVSSCTGVPCSLHLFLPQDFLGLCVQFQSTSPGASARRRQYRPLHSPADKALLCPGIWTSEAAPEAQAQGTGCQHPAGKPHGPDPHKTCPSRSSRSCYLHPDLRRDACSQASRKASWEAKEKRWKKARYQHAALPSGLDISTYPLQEAGLSSFPSRGIPGTNSCQDDCLLTSSHTMQTPST